MRHCFLSLLSFLLLGPLAHTAEDTDDQRAELARAAAEYLALDADHERTPGEERRYRELDLAIGHLLVGLLESPTEDEASALIAEVLREHRPEALPLFEERAESSAGDATHGRLLTLCTALEMFLIMETRYPESAEGFLPLLHTDPPLLDEAQLQDGWGAEIRYVSDEAYTYDLESAGPDGAFGTDDDYRLDETGEIRRGSPEGAGPGDSSRIGTLPEPAQLWSLDMYAEGHGVAYVAARDDGTYAGFGDLERGPFDTLVRMGTGTVPGAAAFQGVRGSRQYLVTRESERPLDGTLLLAAFVEGTDVPLLAVQKGENLHAWIGERRMRIDGSALELGEVGPAVVNAEGHVCAYRERRAEGFVLHLGARELGPFEWVAQPSIVAREDGDFIAYRVWDGSQMTVGFAGREQRVDWARDLVVSADGQHTAYVETSGGTPLPDFKIQREAQSAERLQTGFVETRAFQGGEERLVVNGTPSPWFAWVEEPVFAAESDEPHLVFRGRNQDGEWLVGHYVGGEFRFYGTYETVERPVLDRNGLLASFLAERAGTRVLCFNESAIDFAHDVELVPGPDGRIAYAFQEEDGYAFGVYDHEDGNRWFGSFTAIHRLEFPPGTDVPYALVESAEGFFLAAGNGLATPPVVGLSNPVLVEPGRVACVTRDAADRYAPLVLDLVANEVFRPEDLGYGGALGPVVTESGKLAFRAVREGGIGTWPDGSPMLHGENYEVIVFDGSWNVYELGDRVFDLEGGPDSFSFTVVGDSGAALTWQVGTQLRGGPRQDLVLDVAWAADGSPVYQAKVGDDYRVFGNERSSAEHRFLEDFGVSPETGVPVFRASSWTENWRWFVDWVEGPPLPTLRGGLLWNEAGDHVAYRGNEGGESYGEHFVLGGKDTLVLVDVDAPGDWRTVEGDAISEPVFSEDGRTLSCVVMRGTELFRVELAL